MIRITINTEEDKIKVTAEVNSNGKDAIDEFKILNKEFPNIRATILKRFPLFIQARILTDMLEIIEEDKEE